MKNTTLKKIFAAATLALVIAPALSGCVESQMDVARKPDLVQQITKNSIDRCDLQASFNQTDSYEARLASVLEKTSSASLDYVIGNDITVCLDQRLAQIDKGFFERTPYAIYYRDQNVMSLYDKGKIEGGLFEFTAKTYGHHFIEKFDTHNIQLKDAFSIGVRSSCGKSCRTSKWLGSDNLWGGQGEFMIKHPELSTPPLKTGIPSV